MGQLSVDELLGVDDPLVEDLAQEPALLEDAESCREQKRMHPKPLYLD
jgi:hypothetical protein